MWKKLKHLILDFMKVFHEYDNWLFKINNTEIILIPKVRMATSQTNFLISLAMLSKCVTLRQFEVVGFKVKEIRHIALFVISGSVRKFSVIDCVNICLSTIFFQQILSGGKVWSYPTLLILWFITLTKEYKIFGRFCVKYQMIMK